MRPAIFLLILVFASCQNQTRPVSEHVKELTPNSPFYNLNVDGYTYEGCEYIVVGPAGKTWGSHKGNCKNPIHKN